MSCTRGTLRHPILRVRPSRSRRCPWALPWRWTSLRASSASAGAAAPATGIDRASIAAAHGVIRPYIRRTPVIEIDGADFGLGPLRSFLKLEFMQHAGSFKARGAFANLLLRDVPAAGVVAASGGNHGVAVAYAAMRLGKPARIFVPSIASPAKMARIAEFKAELVVTGERYADALAESQAFAASSGALQVQ